MGKGLIKEKKIQKKDRKEVDIKYKKIRKWKDTKIKIQANE
jgi:hypothetical protein